MSELVKRVAKRADITTAKAKKAVEAVTAYLEEKLPKPLASVVITVLGESEGILGHAGGLIEGLGGLGGVGEWVGSLGLGGVQPDAPDTDAGSGSTAKPKPKPKPKPKEEAESPKPKPKPKPKPAAPKPKPKPKPKTASGRRAAESLVPAELQFPAGTEPEVQPPPGGEEHNV